LGNRREKQKERSRVLAVPFAFKSADAQQVLPRRGELAGKLGSVSSDLGELRPSVEGIPSNLEKFADGFGLNIKNPDQVFALGRDLDELFKGRHPMPQK
jgi:hypothetical protein